MKRPAVFVLTLSVSFLIEAAAPAHAYLDPGTGSMMLQALLGAIVGGLLVCKLYWQKIEKFINGLKGKSSVDNSTKGSNSQ